MYAKLIDFTSATAFWDLDIILSSTCHSNGLHKVGQITLYFTVGGKGEEGAHKQVWGRTFGLI